MSDLAIDVELTADAAQWIRDKGGRLYLHMGVLGLPVVTRATLRRPSRKTSSTFTTIAADGVEILIQSNLRPPRKLRISRSRALPRLRVEWDGQPWGWRFLTDTA